MMKMFVSVVGVSATLILFSACTKEETVEPSNSKSITQKKISIPVRLKATATSTSSIAINWQDTSLFATAFRIQRRDTGDWLFDTLIGSSTTFNDSNLRCKTRYYYHVSAYNSLDSSGFSTQASTVTLTDDITLLSSGTTSRLYGVYFTSESRGYVVGERGTILGTTDGGQTWNPLSSGVLNVLRGVCFSDTMTGIVVGNGGTILTTFDGGVTWVLQLKLSANNLLAVTYLGSHTWIAAGAGGVILRSADDGFNWDIQIFESSGSTTTHNSVAFANGNIGIIVGAKGTILRTTDGGVTWSKQVSQTLRDLYGVSFADEDSAVAVGYAGITIRTTNAGKTWSRPFIVALNSLNTVSFRADTEAIVVGARGIVMDSDNSGQTWVLQQSSITNNNIYSTFYKNANEAIAVGDLGMIMLISTCRPALYAHQFRH